MVWEMGGGFKREGSYVYLRLIHVDVWQKSTQYCKQLNLKLKKKNQRAKQKMNKKGKHEICSQKIAAVVKLKQNVKIKT